MCTVKKRSEIRVHRNNCTGLKIFRNWGAALSHRHLVRKTSFNNYRSKYFGISTTIPIHHFRKPSIFNWFMVFGSVWVMPYFNWLRISTYLKIRSQMDQLKMMDFWMKYKPLPHFLKNCTWIGWIEFDLIFPAILFLTFQLKKKSESILKQMANVLI